jgi:integrase
MSTKYATIGQLFDKTLARMTNLVSRNKQNNIIPSDSAGLTFNFAMALPGRASSRHTQRAYFRWVDTYLVDMADYKPTKGDARLMRMHALPIVTLREILSAQQLRAWLGILIGRGHGKQGIEQARASIITLADLLTEAEWFDDRDSAAMSRVRPPRAEDGQRQGRWLSLDQIHMLMAAMKEIATSENQALRNTVMITILCTMALRREEISVAKWGDLSLQNNRVVMRIHGKGRKVATVDVPRPVVNTLDKWRKAVTPGELHPPAGTPLLRRIWKGGGISKGGVSAEGIWYIIEHAAQKAGIGHVAPHDLRRSVAGALHQSGVPVEKISRLLRHSNIAVTERYLNRLPHAVEGATLMSEALGLEDDPADWPGYED